MAGSALTITSVNGQQTTEFKQLILPKSVFFINRNGFPSVDEFTVKLANQDKKVTLADILGVKQESIYAKR